MLVVFFGISSGVLLKNTYAWSIFFLQPLCIASPSHIYRDGVQGVGRLALGGLVQEAEKAGFWKLVSRVFVENAASRALLRRLSFREVGVYEKHAQLDGIFQFYLLW